MKQLLVVLLASSAAYASPLPLILPGTDAIPSVPDLSSVAGLLNTTLASLNVAPTATLSELTDALGTTGSIPGVPDVGTLVTTLTGLSSILNLSPNVSVNAVQDIIGSLTPSVLASIPGLIGAIPGVTTGSNAVLPLLNNLPDISSVLANLTNATSALNLLPTLPLSDVISAIANGLSNSGLANPADFLSTLQQIISGASLSSNLPLSQFIQVLAALAKIQVAQAVQVVQNVTGGLTGGNTPDVASLVSNLIKLKSLLKLPLTLPLAQLNDILGMLQAIPTGVIGAIPGLNNITNPSGLLNSLSQLQNSLNLPSNLGLGDLLSTLTGTSGAKTNRGLLNTLSGDQTQNPQALSGPNGFATSIITVTTLFHLQAETVSLGQLQSLLGSLQAIKDFPTLGLPNLDGLSGVTGLLSSLLKAQNALDLPADTPLSQVIKLLKQSTGLPDSLDLPFSGASVPGTRYQPDDTTTSSDDNTATASAATTPNDDSSSGIDDDGSEAGPDGGNSAAIDDVESDAAPDDGSSAPRARAASTVVGRDVAGIPDTDVFIANLNQVINFLQLREDLAVSQVLNIFEALQGVTTYLDSSTPGFSDLPDVSSLIDNLQKAVTALDLNIDTDPVSDIIDGLANAGS